MPRGIRRNRREEEVARLAEIIRRERAIINGDPVIENEPPIVQGEGIEAQMIAGAHGNIQLGNNPAVFVNHMAIGGEVRWWNNPIAGEVNLPNEPEPERRAERGRARFIVHDDDFGLKWNEEMSDSKDLDPESTVKLHKGGSAKVKNCVQTTCGRWFKKEDPEVVIDHYTGKNCFIQICIPIIVSYNNDGIPNEKVLAYTHERNVFTHAVSICYKNGSDVHEVWADFDSIPKEVWAQCFVNGKFYHKDCPLPKSLKHPKYRKANAIKKSDKSKELSLTEMYKFGIKTPTYYRTEGKRYSFGVELETTRGYLPGYLDKDLNYEAVHDGSLREADNEVWGAEYVTGVLVGDTGLLQLKRLCNELTKRCKIDKKCGMHIHLGNFDLSKQSIVLLYKLLLMVENEMFLMLPPSRRKNQFCRELKRIELKFTENDLTTNEYNLLIEKYYSSILKFISGTEGLSHSVNRKEEHPLGHKCGYNHGSARYCWINLVPALFNTRGNGVYTIEFRSHSGTTSYEKIKYWLLICMAILWFVENHGREIALLDNISIREIINKAYPKYADKINSYIDMRYKKFNSSSKEMNETMEILDYEETVSAQEESLSIKNI